MLFAQRNDRPQRENFLSSCSNAHARRRNFFLSSHHERSTTELSKLREVNSQHDQKLNINALPRKEQTSPRQRCTFTPDALCTKEHCAVDSHFKPSFSARSVAHVLNYSKCIRGPTLSNLRMACENSASSCDGCTPPSSDASSSTVLCWKPMPTSSARCSAVNVILPGTDASSHNRATMQ